MAHVPFAVLANGQAQWMFLLGMSSPIMNVLLVPSAMSASRRLWRKSVRKKMPSPSFSPLYEPSSVLLLIQRASQAMNGGAPESLLAVAFVYQPQLAPLTPL